MNFLIEKAEGELVNARMRGQPQTSDKLASEPQARDDTVVGNTAIMYVRGAIFKSRNFWGFQSYVGIRAALAALESDPAVKHIDIEFDSPGGMVDGLFETMDAIKSAKTSTRAVLRNQCCSAAYALASQCDEVVAFNDAASVGSVGVVSSYVSSSSWKSVEITSTNAPNKRPDVETEEGRAVVRAQLDEIHDLMVDRIAQGRDISTSHVNSNFGRGGVMLAGAAKKAGMIDAVLKNGGVKNRGNNANDTTGGRKMAMTKEELQANEPTAYAAAVADGVEKERSRCKAHLTMGEAAGALDIAIEAIGSGVAASDDATHAQYMAAKINKAGVEARQADDEPADKIGAESEKTQAESENEKIAQSIVAKLGGYNE